MEISETDNSSNTPAKTFQEKKDGINSTPEQSKTNFLESDQRKQKKNKNVKIEDVDVDDDSEGDEAETDLDKQNQKQVKMGKALQLK